MLSASCVVFSAALNPSAALSPPTFLIRSLKTESNSTQWPSPSMTGWSRPDRICAAVRCPFPLMSSLLPGVPGAPLVPVGRNFSLPSAVSQGDAGGHPSRLYKRAAAECRNPADWSLDAPGPLPQCALIHGAVPRAQHTSTAFCGGDDAQSDRGLRRRNGKQRG